MLLAGAAASASIYFRDEFYVYCLVLLGVVAVCSWQCRWRAVGILAASMVVALIPLWLFQWFALGSPLGLHVAEGGKGLLTAEWLKTRPTVLYYLFVASGPNGAWSAILAVPFLAACALRPRLSDRLYPIGVIVAAAAGLVFLAWAWSTEDVVSWLLQAGGLFACAPLMMLAGLRRRDAQRPDWPARCERAIRGVAIVYPLLYAAASPAESSMGLHWGNRFLLVLYPLLVLLATANLAAWWSRRTRRINIGNAALIALVLVSLAGQVFSIRTLSKMNGFSWRLNQAVAGRPEGAIITSTWWVPQMLYGSYYSKAIFRIGSESQWAELTRVLEARGHMGILVVYQIPPGQARTTAPAVSDEGVGFFRVGIQSIGKPS